jgi:hypothetical protein
LSTFLDQRRRLKPTLSPILMDINTWRLDKFDWINIHFGTFKSELCHVVHSNIINNKLSQAASQLTMFCIAIIEGGIVYYCRIVNSHILTL